jgi:hypothetical protein
MSKVDGVEGAAEDSKSQFLNSVGPVNKRLCQALYQANQHLARVQVDALDHVGNGR